ncbi:Hypothetical predicted protein [Mytilus galloprovincialis]|uniref:Uncharacterized protein n=2 Tax=Mytilus galloprovincialis TaxID=29158 RepID=A0A8B6CER6_MYTGA|nr:Hypothetical predicted protein [Mytilus galloprovincialis]
MNIHWNQDGRQADYTSIMNTCNFAKILITRSTKDKESLKYWDEKSKPQLQEPLKTPSAPKYDTTISPAKRFHSYNNYITGCPKMAISFDKFRRSLPKLEKEITTNSNWSNSNKTQDKTKYIKSFSLYAWDKLTLQKKNNHTIYDCKACLVTNSDIASSHCSYPSKNRDLVELCTNITDTILENSPPTSKGIENEIQNFVQILSPIAEKKLGIDLTKSVSKIMKLTPKKSYLEKRKIETTCNKENNTKIMNQIAANDADVKNFLSSVKSYNQYDRDRLSAYHISHEEAETSMLNRVQKEQEGKNIPKKHHGNFTSYTFDQDMFLDEVKSTTPGSKVNWQYLARKYNVLNKNGIRPLNGGQVLKQFAQDNGVNIHSFNPQSRVSGRDYIRRVRRAKKRLTKRQSIPSVKTANNIKSIVKKKLDTGVINIGKKIIPTRITSNTINKEGTNHVYRNIYILKEKPCIAEGLTFDFIHFI